MSESPTITPISVSEAPYFWGIDVGGTGIKLGLVDNRGQTVAYHRIATEESRGPQSAVDRIANVIKSTHDALSLDEDVAGAGLGAPGPMDLHAGTLVAPPQLPSWWNFPIRDAVAQAIGRPVYFLNDANAAAYGEFWLGSGRDDSSMVLLTLGTGVGGGIIVDDELVNGVNSFGSECGHMIVDSSPDAQICVWGGGRGHLEAYASASGVVQRTIQRLKSGQPSQLQAILNDPSADPTDARLDQTRLTAKDVYLAALDGDALALEMIDDTAKWLGIGVTNLVHALDPGSIVLGGAMNFGGPECAIGQRFLNGISNEFRQRTFDNVFRGTTIKFATLGADAGYLGVAGYARKKAAMNR